MKKEIIYSQCQPDCVYCNDSYYGHPHPHPGQVPTGYRDEVGGIHDEGLGWNPQGHFCGECGSLTCKDCPSTIVDDDIQKVLDMCDDALTLKKMKKRIR